MVAELVAAGLRPPVKDCWCLCELCIRCGASIKNPETELVKAMATPAPVVVVVVVMEEK